MSIKCRCGTTYEYNPAVELESYLTFEDEKKQILEFILTAPVKIGREDNSDYVTITNQDDPSLKQNLYLRNVYVSRQHSKIAIQEEFTLLKNGLPKILSKRKCILQDCGSTNGTAVNDRLLKPHEEKELKHNDTITLAPNSQFPLILIFRER